VHTDIIKISQQKGSGRLKLEWKTCWKVGISVFLLYICIHFWPVAAALLKTLFSAASPLFIGAAVAYILNILMSAYERCFFVNCKKPVAEKLRRPVCLVGALLTLIAIVVLVVVLVVPQLKSCVKLIIAELPDFMDNMLGRIHQWGLLPEDIIATLENTDWQSWIGQIVSGVGDVVGVLFSAVSSVFSAVVTALVAVIFAIYLLASKEKLATQCNRIMGRYLPGKWHKRMKYVLDILDDCFHRYIVGQCVEAVILGVLCALGMLALRLPYAAMIGAMIAFTALIPVAGAWIGAGVGAFLILMESPMQALIFLVFILILQQLENNLIYPKVVGSSIGLPGIWVLAAVTLGGGMMGVVGMLLGVPITAAIYRIVRDDVQKSNDQAVAVPETKEDT